MFYRYHCGCVALSLEVAGIHMPVVLIEGCRRDPCDDQYMFHALDSPGMNKLASQYLKGDCVPLDGSKHRELIETLGRLVSQGQQLETVADILRGVKP
jgi:hypothetical protein